MSKVLFVLAAVAAISCGKTQTSTTYFEKPGIYGRSDGLFLDAATKSPVILENAQQAMPVGVGFHLNLTDYADGEGLYCEDTGGLGACGGNTTLVPCSCTFPDGNKVIQIPLVTADAPIDMDAGSLDIGSDQTDNDGLMLVWGVGGASGRPFVVGRDPAFYMCTVAAFADATGIDQNIMAGFMRVQVNEAWNADFEARDTYAGIGVLGTAAAGVTAEDITIKTELAAAGVVTTDTTNDATEALQYTYCVFVSAAGVVTYTVNGAAPTVTAAVTLTDNISVVPFITYLHTADLAGEIDIYSVSVGYQD